MQTGNIPEKEKNRRRKPDTYKGNRVCVSTLN